MKRGLLAVPMLGDRGGGVGQVSTLIWRVMQEECGDKASMMALLQNGNDRPTAAEKIRFGAGLAGKHLVARPDWIFFTHLGLARVERYLPSFCRVPYAVFLHGIEAWDELPAADREILRRASLRVANSAFTARRTSDANPGIGEIAVCPLALNEPPQSASTSPGKSPTVLVVGRLSARERYKGHEQLIRAWPRVVSVVPDARLVIVGDGDDLPRLRQIAWGLPCSPAIEFTGFLSRNDLSERYAQAALFAMPSRGEGFGLVYLEAMAAGLPCVGSRHDAAGEVIVDGKTGVLVDLDRRDALTECVVTILQNPNRARELGEAGRVRVRQEFSYAAFRNRLTALLRDAFSARGVATGAS